LRVGKDAHSGVGTTAQVDIARPRIERALVTCFLAIRTVHVLQGLACVRSARTAYRRPFLATGAELAAIAELAFLARRTVAAGTLERDVVLVDTAFGLVGLAILAAATDPTARTSSLNWMLPLTVGSGLAASSLPDVAEGMALTVGLATAYGLGTRSNSRQGGGPAATAFANVLSYPTFYAVGRIFIQQIRRIASELDDARQTAVVESARAATAAARNKEHRLLHDSALQVLEAVAHSSGLAEEGLRRQAQREVLAIRRALAGEELAPESLSARLDALVVDFAERDLRVDLVDAELEEEPGVEASTALSEAVREALTNVVKHSGVDKVVLHVATAAGGVRVTVRDHGKGFDTSAPTDGYGLDHSIKARMAEIGGRTAVWSEPDRGTRVELWAPTY
jgi:signal transduction histidine kinase